MGKRIPHPGRSSRITLYLYLDFLGVSDAATTWGEKRAAGLIAVSQTIAAARAPYTIDGEPLPDGSYKIMATTETSTFSYRIVTSYPLLEETPLPSSILMDMYLKLAQDMMSKIAVEALNVGLLVRGGMTIGKFVPLGRRCVWGRYD